MKKWLLCASMSALVTPCFAQMTLKWEDSLDQGLKRAKAEKKQIFLDIWAEWCGPCRYLKENVFPALEAKQALKDMVPVAVMTQDRQGKAQGNNMKIAEQFRVDAYPTLIVLDSDGKELRRHVGAFQSGAEFAAWIKSGK